MFFDDDNRSLMRLPVYLLLDTSATMAGAPLQAVNQGLQLLFTNLLHMPQAQQAVYLSVVTFGSTAQVVSPLTELLAFQPPLLRTRGASSLGAGLQRVAACMEQEVRASTPHHQGDYRPVLFIMTDGQPTDDWETSLRQLQKQRHHPSSIVTLLCAADGVGSGFKATGTTILNINQVTGEHLLSLLQWIHVD